MAESDPILQNLTGCIFLMTAEVGVYLQNFGRSTKRERTNIFNVSVGASTGFYAIDPSATYKLKGFQSGSTGIPAAAPGVALVIAGVTTGNGVSGGGIYTESAALDHAAKQLREYDVEAIQMPGVT